MHAGCDTLTHGVVAECVVSMRKPRSGTRCTWANTCNKRPVENTAQKERGEDGNRETCCTRERWSKAGSNVTDCSAVWKTAMATAPFGRRSKAIVERGWVVKAKMERSGKSESVMSGCNLPAA